MRNIFLIVVMVLMCGSAWSANQWYQGGGTSTPPLQGTTRINDIDSASQNYAFDPLDRMLMNYRSGQVLTYASASTLTVTSGEIVVRDVADSAKLMLRNASNTTVTWTDIDTGTEAVSTQYYVYAIAVNSSSTTVTYKISLSSTAPTGATYYRRLGSFYNDASGNITTTDITNDNNFYPAVGYGDWTSKSISVPYLALTDGEAYVYTTGGGDRRYYGYTDSSSSPSTVKMAFSTYPDGSETHAQHFDVKKGDYWEITYSGGSGSPTVTWLPKGN